MAQWEAEAPSGSAESAATETAEMTMEPPAPYGYIGVPILSPLTDGDSLASPFAEVLSIPKLVYLDISA